MDFTGLVSLSARLFEGAGVAVMVVGAFVSVFMVPLQRHKGSGESGSRPWSFVAPNGAYVSC
ncbi:MAG TPA: hypothetical protein VF794_12095 [Archangium sp.]|jgi:membrane protein YdbS with pleckstrin-like domain|uniref:hypothetical protein n=1 Tax=Archangium sp. TaxID=1872627 RepID=UPI002ED9D736